jgi:HSP20 family protein
MAKKDSDSVAHFFGNSATDDDEFNLTLESSADETPAPGTHLEGEVAVDVYQTEGDVVIVSPIAGVDPDDIEIDATDDTVTITGIRTADHVREEQNLITQEIYWGPFSRAVELPAPCEVDKAEADFKHGILTITIPKTAKARKRTIKVKKSE